MYNCFFYGGKEKYDLAHKVFEGELEGQYFWQFGIPYLYTQFKKVDILFHPALFFSIT